MKDFTAEEQEEFTNSSKAGPVPARWQKEMAKCYWFTTAQPFTAPKAKVVTGIGHAVL